MARTVAKRRTPTTNTSSSRVLSRRRRGSRKAQTYEGGVKGGGVFCTDTPDFVIDLLKAPPKRNFFREGKYLHVSDLIYKCMRMVALSYRTDTKLVGDPLFDSTLTTFAQGDGIHDFVKSKARDVNPSAVYGVWSCVCEHTKVTGTYAEAKQADACVKCEKPLNQYEELTVYNDDAMLVGNIDLTFLIEGYLYICEIKSIKHEEWNTLERALPIHILQVLFYFWLARESGYSIHSQVSILYVTKNYVRGSPYKEIVLNAGDMLHRLDDYIEDAKALKASRSGGDLPIRTCPKIDAPTAKRCELASLCFNMSK